MLKFLVAIIFFITFGFSQAGAQITRQWVATHNGQGDFNDRFTCLTTDGSGNLYYGGSTVNPNTDRDFLVIKTSATGQVLWGFVFDGSDHAADEVTAMAIDAAGNLIVTGISKGDNTSEDFLTIKLTTTGDTLWTKRYDFTGEYDQPNAIAVGPDNRIVVAGLSDGDPGSGENDDYLILNYNTDGVLLWANRFNGLGDAIDRATSVAVNTTGKIFVTGRSDNGDNDDMVTICYNMDGAQQWIKYDDQGGRDRGVALALDHQQNLIVTGQSSNGDNDDFWILKYDANGNQLWQLNYDNVDDDRPIALAIDASNNVFVTGQSDKIFGIARNWDIATVAVSANGAPLWTMQYDGAASQDDFPTAVATDVSGNVFVTGRSDQDAAAAIDEAIVTLSYKISNGTQNWKSVYTALPDHDNAGNAVATDGAGGCWVAGFAEDTAAFRNALIIRYRSTGTQQSILNINGVGDNNDAVRHLVVDNNGMVYAAGFTVSNGDSRNLSLWHFDESGSYVCRYVENGSAASAYDDAQGLLLNQDGLPLVMGYAKNSGSSNDIFLALMNADCDTLWLNNINGGANGSERAYSMTRDGAGAVYLTGRTDIQAGPIANDVCFTLKINELTGSVLWSHKYDPYPGTNQPERGVAVRVSNTGEVYVLGRAFNGSQFETFLTHYDANGNQLWVKTWNTTGDTDPIDLQTDLNGNLYILATSTDGNATHAAAWACDANGNTLFSKENLLPDYLNTQAVACGLYGGGEMVILAKYIENPGANSTDHTLVGRLDNSGNLVWVEETDPPGVKYCVPDAIGLNIKGQIFFTTHVNAGTTALPDNNIYTAMLSPGGDLLWSDTYSGTMTNGSDIPNTLLVDGTACYIGGSTEVVNQQRNALVIKYQGMIDKVTDNTVPDLLFYPNPAHEQVVFDHLPTSVNWRYDLTDVSGRIWKQGHTEGAANISIPLADCPEGWLFCRFITPEGYSFSHKFIHLR